MMVIKFGGSSVASSKNIRIVKQIVEKQEQPLIVVVSAFAGITNLLIETSELAAASNDSYLKLLEQINQKHTKMIKELIPGKNQGKILASVNPILSDLEDLYRGVFLIKELSLKTQDKILSFGETLSSLIINAFFTADGMPSKWANATNFIKTNSDYGRATVNFTVSNKAIKNYFKDSEGLWVCPGFIASDKDNSVTTLGRGGSDYTAAILAGALKTKGLEIWTDVSGMMTADPRIVKSAYVIERLSYDEAMELSHFGAKVLYSPTIQPAMEAGISIHIKNTFDPTHPGTTIGKKSSEDASNIIKGLSCIQQIALINLTGSGMVGIPNFSHRLFKSLSSAKVNVIMITQASSEHSICVGINQADAKTAKEAIEIEFENEIATHILDAIIVEENLAIIALVGSLMRQQVGVSGKMFSILGQNGISIKAIAQGSTEKNISVVITEAEVKKAMNSLHESFFLTDKKQLNVFIIGVGNVGGTLIGQLQQQKNYLSKHHHIELRVVGLANSKKMLFEEEGISLNNWKETLLKKGTKMSLPKFVEVMQEANLRNSIFVDNTAEDSVASLYQQILKKSISVVTPNKIACTKSMQAYKDLKQTALINRTKFLFETNVGAGLPIINTLSDLMKSGDEIVKIEAVLSGSLNFIFNNFREDTKFVDIVKQAQQEGYTEPDPRIDLSGVDVMRKILILIREAGYEMELNQITAKPFMPAVCLKTKTVDGFFDELKKHEKDFQELLQKAKSKKAKLKYVASFNKGKAEAGLQMVTAEHPFYNLEGKDNIVLFYTKRYADQPLVIKGAGAGAAVTAMGIFGDIMRIAHG